MANLSSCGMNMTMEGTETLYRSLFAAVVFSSSQHLSCRFWAQPPVSSVLFTCSVEPCTKAAYRSVHSGRWGFLGSSRQCMPARGSAMSLVLLWLVPTSTVSQIRLACVAMCSATCLEISVPRDSANMTSSKWRADLPKTEELKASGKRPTTFRSLSCKYRSASSVLLRMWSRSTWRLTHFTICCQFRPWCESYSKTAPSTKSFRVGKAWMPNLSPMLP
mmetsp:Transcript_99062/g.295963  ORF Transcript_99062/g.295963 Transcript_99062/m.295963 type:complete len:219 (-) Transcript_99062:310-966(-)